MLLTISTWLGLRSDGPRPMIIRVGEPSDTARTVELVARWRVSGKEVVSRRRLYVSDGMCLLAWTRDAGSVEIEVCLPAGSQRLTVQRGEYHGQVLDARL